MNLIEQTVKLLQENYKLEEFAKSKSDITRDLYDGSKQVIEHLIRCLLWSDDTENLNHWKTEVIGALYSISKYKNSNKFPTMQQLTSWFLKDKLEELAYSLDTTIRIVCRKENKPVPKYDIEKILRCIAEYLTWLCTKLSETGVCNDTEMENKIDELICQYK